MEEKKKLCVPCGDKESKKPCTKCLTKKENEDFVKLSNRKDKEKLSDNQKKLVIKKAFAVLGVPLKHDKFACVDSFNFWIDKINLKI